MYDEDSGGPSHLHILISDPNLYDELVFVSVTTRRRNSDTMVCLEAGDHEFITHPSVITYAYSKIISKVRLIAMLADGDAAQKPRVSDKLLIRAQEGMLETDRAPYEVQQFFKMTYNK